MKSKRAWVPSRWLPSLVLVWTLVSLQPSVAVAGIWAAAAKSAGSKSEGSFVVRAPSGPAAVVYASDGVYLQISRRRTILDDAVEPPPLTEVLWAPTSRAFVITASDGGNVGTWRAHFYFLDENNNPIPRDIRGLIGQDADAFANCQTREQVNLAAITWLKGGSELLVVAEVPPHSSCQNMGALMGFVISVKSWAVEKKLSQKDMLSKFRKRFGTRLSTPH
jgi:hypothetical protein